MAAFAPSFQYEAMDINTFPEELSRQTSAMIIFQSLTFVQIAPCKKGEGCSPLTQRYLCDGPFRNSRIISMVEKACML